MTEVNINTVDATKAHNKRVEAVYLEEWKGQPDHFTAYYDFPGEKQAQAGRWRQTFYPAMWGAHVLTFLDTPLGKITSARVFTMLDRSGSGYRMVTMHVKGNNGAHYYGRASWDNGNVINLRKVKG